LAPLRNDWIAVSSPIVPDTKMNGNVGPNPTHDLERRQTVELGIAKSERTMFGANSSNARTSAGFGLYAAPLEFHRARLSSRTAISASATLSSISRILRALIGSRRPRPRAGG
jgi:hypothetical protein